MQDLAEKGAGAGMRRCPEEALGIVLLDDAATAI
jgi:hypothetical protein